MFAIVLSKPVVKDGMLVQVIGPFPSVHAASQWSWKRENWWAAETGSIEPMHVIMGGENVSGN